MPTQNQQVNVLVREILEYFELHPNAADSLEGIMKWWLKHQEQSISEDALVQALTYLREEGLVIETSGQSGKTIYSNAKSDG